MKVKNSAIIYTGYDYQTLQGVKLLAEWLRSPTQYTRVAFEADIDANETPEGIDDIVCERPNGIKDFWQVKFTPTPEKEANRLTWEWLLKISGKTARSRSIIKKLYDAIIAVPVEKLGDVVLLTNKLPDRDIESCLFGSKIDFNQIEDNTKREIIRQLGSSVAATFLLSKLTIQHSDGDYHTTSRTIRTELLKFSDNAGVERLISRSREWAMFQNNPPNNGWIYLHHVREVLSPRRPEPIPEIFSVPEDYCLPDTGFHNKLLNKVIGSNGEVITLTGKPGIGKSTYLSFLCKELEEQEIPLVRHHYFLSLGDSTDDRLSPRVVAESLLHQINIFHKEASANTSQPEHLRDALTICADYYKTKDKPFVVLIDGLDHVWRDNAKNKKPLDELFKQLLPVKDNLVILVGTQPVDDALLPRILLSNSPKHEWHWLPEMSGNSLYEFLKRHIEAGRLFLNCHENHSDEEIRESAKALLDVTNGYPLHVIYSSEFLSNQGLALSSWQIKKLPPCSDGNIITYYSELWRDLNYKQKDVLHLCCDFQFAWPRQAIGSVVNDEHDNAPSVDAVAHLLSEGISGVRPFHESLVVFVKNQVEHQDRIDALLPYVCGWLDSEAPTHLKDNWLWSSLARAGDSSKLRQGVTRDWILDKLIVGMPVKSCIRLLSEAETYAFQELNYAEAYRHRELKTRLINGPRFQIWDSTSLEILSLVIANKTSLNEIISGQNEYSPVKLSVLAVALWYRGEVDQAKLLSKNAIGRYRAKSKLLSSRHSQDDETETVALIKAGVLTDSLNYNAIFQGEHFSSWPDGYITSFRSACCARRELDLLLRGWNSLPPNSNHAGPIELDAIRLSIMEDADILCRPEYKLFSSQELSNFADTYSKHGFSNITTEYFDSQSDTVFKVETSKCYHAWFFSSLCIRLQAAGDFTWLPVSSTSERVDVSVHYDLLNKLVDVVANKLLAGSTLNFDLICSMFTPDSLLDEMQWETRRSEISLRRKWIEIAADCHLITTKSKISYHELKNTIDSGVFKSDWLRLWYKEVGLDLLYDDAACLLIECEIRRQFNELEETIMNSNAYLELAQIAFQQEQQGLFKSCLRKSWDFVLGYGHHKDSTIFDVLKAVEYLLDADPDSALKILERISPIVFNISDFTDGDETRHSKHSMSSLVTRLNPQTAASIYDQELSDGEWYYAEKTILVLLERCGFSSSVTKNLYMTGLHSSCCQVLRKRFEQGDAIAAEIVDQVERQYGIAIQNQEDDKPSTTDEFNDNTTVQHSDYPPDKFGELVAALKGKYSTSKFWKAWYTYWLEQDKEMELLQHLTPLIPTFTDRLDEKRHLLDLLFFSQRKLKGKTHAFYLLVAAHDAMNGWSDLYESADNSINRLRIVAEQYPQKIDEFIQLTTSQPDSWKDKFGDLIIPSNKLVFLLTQTGRNEEALQLTLQMVKGLEDSVRNIQLAKPDWDWRRDDCCEEALTKSIVSRLKLPIPSIKLWTVEQLSLLLVDGHPKVEDLLLEDLASRQQESECVEVLCVFFIAKTKGYVCPNDLGRYVKARSTLSDLLLSELDSIQNGYGLYSSSYSPLIQLDGDNHRFEYYQGSHVPRLYNSCLEKEEERTGIPFTEYYQSEWNNTFKYQPLSATSIDYFFSGDRQRATGQFYTQASHRGRSAYLRTLEVAKQFYGMPNSYAEQLSILALPIEPAYIGLNPQKPTWLPDWDVEVLPKRENLSQFVKQALVNFGKHDDAVDLLALSLPIKLDDNNWIDLTVVKATIDSDEATIQFDERSGCLSVGSLLDAKISYEHSKIKKSKNTALAGTPYPLNRYGYWHSDLEARGLYLPKCIADGRNITGSACDGVFCYYVDNIKIGSSSFWYNDWQPVHPKELRSLCGTLTSVERARYSLWYKNDDMIKCLYACRARILHSEGLHREFAIENQEFRVAIED
jgi:Cdc6-like AAA superfamily ATPase